jgi:hypothetical protein
MHKYLFRNPFNAAVSSEPILVVKALTAGTDWVKSFAIDGMENGCALVQFLRAIEPAVLRSSVCLQASICCHQWKRIPMFPSGLHFTILQAHAIILQ